MRSRRSVLVLLLSAAVLSACGGGGNDGNRTEPALAPTTTVGQTSLLTSVATIAPASSAPATTPAPTTLAPTTLTPSTLAATAIPTTTRQAVTLPPGVTETDRNAAEAAAIGWWEEYYRQLDSLPGFDPAAILRKSVAGRPAGPALIAQLSKLESEGLKVRRGKIRKIAIVGTRFTSSTTAEVIVCGADDDAFIYTTTGAIESEGLARLFLLNVLERDRNGWTMADYGSARSSELGKSCE